MGYGDDEILFYERDGLSLVSAQVAQAGAAVEALPASRLASATDDELTAELVGRYSVVVPTLKRDEISAKRSEQQVRMMDFGRVIEAQGIIYDIEVPFEGEADVFKIRPSSFDMNPPRGRVGRESITFRISGRDPSVEEIKSKIDDFVSHVEQYLGWHSELWDGLPNQIASEVRSKLQQRRSRMSKAADTDNALASLGIKISK